MLMERVDEAEKGLIGNKLGIKWYENIEMTETSLSEQKENLITEEKEAQTLSLKKGPVINNGSNVFDPVWGR